MIMYLFSILFMLTGHAAQVLPVVIRFENTSHLFLFMGTVAILSSYESLL